MRTYIIYIYIHIVISKFMCIIAITNYQICDSSKSLQRHHLLLRQLFDTWGSGAPVPPPGMGGIGAKLLATTGPD